MILILSGVPNLSHAASLLSSRESRSVTSLHNSYRKSVGINNLTYGRKEAASALKWASELESRNCPLEHSSSAMRSGNGENIYIQWSNGIKLSVDTAVRAWWDEQIDYNYQTNTCAQGKVCGHYTQIIWQSTNRVGCAKAMCSGGQQTEILVCQYNPAGNYQGSRPY